MTWWDALVRAGAVPAAFVPPASMGRTDADDGAVPPPGADLVEGDALRVHPISPAASPPACFLDGIEQWKVVGYDGVVPVVRAYVAAAVRRRGEDRRLRTAFEAARDFAIAPLAGMTAERRRALTEHCPDVVDIALDENAQGGGGGRRPGACSSWRAAPWTPRARRSSVISRSAASPGWATPSGWWWMDYSRSRGSWPGIRARWG